MAAAELAPTVSDLQSEIERRWACTASLIQTVPVRARVDGNRTWDVDVHVFELVSCAKTNTAYAWTSDDRVFASLDIGPIRSPSDAVCATAADLARQRNLALAARA